MVGDGVCREDGASGRVMGCAVMIAKHPRNGISHGSTTLLRGYGLMGKMANPVRVGGAGGSFVGTNSN